MIDRQTLSRFGVDPHLLALIVTVGLALFVPARGGFGEAMGAAALGAVSLLFFLYGARLAPQAVIEGVTHWRLQSLVFALTFVLFPLIGFAISKVLRPWLPDDLAIGLLYLTLMPSTVQSSIAFTSIARGNVPAALCSASASNLLGIIVSPALVALFLSTQGPGFSLKAVEDVALQLLLPFAAGQLARPLIGRWLAAHKALTSIVDRGSILLVVYVAFSEGTAAGVWSQLSWGGLALILTLDFLILLFMLCVSTFAARRFGFSKPDEIAIVFCGSKKSIASGVPMANILFPGHSVGLIVLPLMLFHQVQLFACALLARRYARRPIEDETKSAESPYPRFGEAGAPAE